MRRRALFALGMLTLAAFGLVACTPGDQVDPAALKVAEDLAWLQENKPLVDAKREELQQVRDQLAGNIPPEAAEGATPEGEEATPPPTPEELEAKAAALESEIETTAGELGQRAVEFLNNSGINLGAELTADQQFVVDIKIAEDIAIAKEYIVKGGDYSRAIDIYNASRQQLDPDSELIAAALAEAEEMRWMTEERFGQAKKKMTQDEVRRLLGTVHHTNVRDFPERNVVGWFYKKKEGGASGIYFKEKKKGDGNWLVYNLDFNAIKQKVIEGDGSEG